MRNGAMKTLQFNCMRFMSSREQTVIVCSYFVELIGN